MCGAICNHREHCFKSGSRLTEIAQRVKAHDAVTHKWHHHAEPCLPSISTAFWASLRAKCLSPELQLAKCTGLQISELNLTVSWLYTGQSLFISFQASGSKTAYDVAQVSNSRPVTGNNRASKSHVRQTALWAKTVTPSELQEKHSKSLNFSPKGFLHY